MRNTKQSIKIRHFAGGMGKWGARKKGDKGQNYLENENIFGSKGCVYYLDYNGDFIISC